MDKTTHGILQIDIRQTVMILKSAGNKIVNIYTEKFTREKVFETVI
jgi:hypothetical protein